MTNDDDVLAQVGAHVRAERADDADLEAAARGEREPTAPGALASRAREGDAEARALLAAAQPLGADVEARLTAKLLATRPRATASPAARAAGVWKRRATMLAGPLALAAAMILYITTAGRDAAPELPTYAVTARGEQTMRGAETPGATLRVGTSPTSTYEIVARPAEAAGTKVAAWVFAIGEGEPSSVDALIGVSGEGSVRIRGESRSLRGARELRVVVAPAEALAKYDEALARARAGTSDKHVRVLVVALER